MLKLMPKFFIDDLIDKRIFCSCKSEQTVRNPFNIYATNTNNSTRSLKFTIFLDHLHIQQQQSKKKKTITYFQKAKTAAQMCETASCTHISGTL